MFRPNIDSYFSKNNVETKLQKMIDTSKVNATRVKQSRGKKALRENPQINLTNRYENMIYTGPLYMGSQGEAVQVVYDTGSDWLTVESAQCGTCFGENFDSFESDSWAPSADSKIEEVEYLSGYIEGMTGSDKVCLAEEGSDCVDSFEFFLINYNQLLPPDMDGVLGMCARGLVEGHENGPDYIDALVEAEILTSTTFAFSLSNEEEQSYVDFGEVREAGMSNPDDLKYLSLKDHFFWLGQFSAVRFGNDDSHAYRLPRKVPVIYDTGSSMSIVPEDMAKAFFQNLIGEHEYAQWEEIFLVSCDHSTWPSVFMLTGDNYWVEYLPEDYILPVPDMPEGSSDGICMLGFMAYDLDFFLAGNNFLRGYYSVHNRDSFELGLVPTPNSKKSPVTEGMVPNKPLVEEVQFANFLKNIVITALGMAMWWHFVDDKVPDFADSSFQQKKNPLKSEKSETKSTKKDLEETIAKLQEQLAEKETGNTME